MRCGCLNTVLGVKALLYQCRLSNIPTFIIKRVLQRSKHMIIWVCNVLLVSAGSSKKCVVWHYQHIFCWSNCMLWFCKSFCWKRRSEPIVTSDSEISNEYSTQWVVSSHTYNFWYLYPFILILILYAHYSYSKF